ncbi:MAG TPA: RidA family protein [Promineifilum sp.]|nr:RidA family protein [Promineifilum sp.]HRO24521.1 RidA family protein [Promineifilum sp.]HRO89044.1 RidA family protein [Promineifilum sp.]HRQ12230.1 RidA family protein [Promineifilum sp.]
MEKKRVHTNDAPAAVGPYSQAIRIGDFVFTAGQVALDPASGEMVGNDVAAQTEQVMSNLGAVLAAAGSDLSRVIKTTVFLQSMGDFAAMNAVYARYFPEPFPARSTVEVGALPKGGLVEIECIAHAQ